MGRRALIAVAALACMLLGASAAHATTTCTYSDLGPPGPAGNELTIQTDSAFSALGIYRSAQRIVVSAFGFHPNIRTKDLAGSGGTPTVDNTDHISVTADPFSLSTLGVQASALRPGA